MEMVSVKGNVDGVRPDEEEYARHTSTVHFVISIGILVFLIYLIAYLIDRK